MKVPILIVGNFLSATRGVRSVCEELAIRLASRGWSVITTSACSNRIAKLIDMVITAIGKQRRYTIAHVEVYSGFAFCWAEAVCLVLKALGKPYVLTLHGGNLPAFGRRWPRRVRRILQSADVVTAPSRFLGERMASFRSDVRVIANGIDLKAYPYRLRSVPEPRLVWVRAFHFMYNPLLAVDVVHLLQNRFPAIHLTMVGPDKGDGSFQAVQQAVLRLGIQSTVELTGRVEKKDIASFLHAGDIFLNTTNIDNAPVSVVEAMACGCCTVSTNVGGIPSLLTDGMDALLVPPQDAQLMAEAVNRVLVEKGLGASLSRNARTKAMLHDWETIIPKWEQLFADVAEERRRDEMDVASNIQL